MRCLSLIRNHTGTFMLFCLLFVSFFVTSLFASNSYADTLVDSIDLSSCFIDIGNDNYAYFSDMDPDFNMNFPNFDYQNQSDFAFLYSCTYPSFSGSFDYVSFSVSGLENFYSILAYSGEFGHYYLNDFSSMYSTSIRFYTSSGSFDFEFMGFYDPGSVPSYYYGFVLNHSSPPSLVINFYTEDSSSSEPCPVCPSSPSGSISLSQNGTYDVTNYAEAVVNVPPEIVYGDYHQDLINITNGIYVCAGTILVIYFFYCIYRLIIKNSGVK